MEAFLVLPWLEIIVAGVVGAILSLIGSKIYHYLHQPPGEYELWVDVLARPLLSEYGSNLRRRFGFHVDGKEAEDPFVADFYLWTAGTRDIPVENFDQGNSFRISLGRPLIYHERVEMKGHLSSVNVHEDRDTGSIIVEPGLVRRGSAVHYRLITDGYPEISVTNPVVDLEHYSFMNEWTGKPPVRRKLKALSVILMVGGGIAFLGSLAFMMWAQPSPDDFAFGIMIVLPVFVAASGMQLLTLLDLPPKRARRAVKHLQKALNSRVLDWSRSGSDVFR